MNTAGIYAITHAATGRAYVGSACNVSKRWRAHKSDLSRGCHRNQRLQNGWNKHGAEAYAFSVVEAVADVADLAAREQWHIDSGDSHYNIRKVAESNLGLKASDETRRKMSAAQMGHTHNVGRKASDETRRKLSAASKGHTRGVGRKASDAHRAKISDALRGKKPSDAHRAKLSAASKGRKLSDATRRKISAAKMGNTNLLGHKHSDESRRKMSAAQRVRRASEASTQSGQIDHTGVKQ